MKSQPNAIIADGLRNRKAKGLGKYTFGVSVMTRDYWCADYYNFDVYTFLLTLPHYFDLGPAARDGAIARWDDDFSEMAQMKYWQALRYLTFVGFAGAGFAAPTVAHATCTGGSTLSGYYGMEVSGQVPAGYGKFLNGVVYFNGSCALQVTATVGENQTVQSFVTFLGTYSTNPDNTITITFTPPGAYQALSAAVAEATGAAIGVQDNVDFALAAMTRRLALPPDAPFILFAVARCAGWMAHAMEQATTGAIIRPRARYVGAAPPR